MLAANENIAKWNQLVAQEQKKKKIRKNKFKITIKSLDLNDGRVIFQILFQKMTGGYSQVW